MHIVIPCKTSCVLNKGMIIITTTKHNIHMWQSQVEIEHYFFVYFDRITMSKALEHRTSVKGGAHTCYVDYQVFMHLCNSSLVAM